MSRYSLEEAVREAFLFHYTSLPAMCNILVTDSLKAGKSGSISFTRDRNYMRALKGRHDLLPNEFHCVFNVKYDDIKRRYKLAPHKGDFAYAGFLGISPRWEAEERVITDKISPIRSLIISISVPKFWLERQDAIIKDTIAAGKWPIKYRIYQKLGIMSGDELIDFLKSKLAHVNVQ